MHDLSRQFADHYRSLVDAWTASGKDWRRFSDEEQETIALYFFNSDYGGNGLADYVMWHGSGMLRLTLRGLRRIGAERLADIVQRCFELLAEHGFDEETHEVDDFLEGLPPGPQAEFDRLQEEAAALYEDFYTRWEQHFASGRG